MSKKPFRLQASSSRALLGVSVLGGFGSASTATLSYLTEPPNLSSISDPNVVVAFKNLSKSHPTTKTKASEDLRSYVQAHPFEQDGGVEDSILEAWVKMYPRISIDEDLRVRELSHSITYELLLSAKKRMEKHLPQIVGAWLAGTCDRDRMVARAASDGVSSLLDTDEKVTKFWRKCQAQILDYCTEAINETAQTLSDERSVSPDSAEAKYHRVIAASLSLLLNLLLKLNAEDFVKCQDKYDSFWSVGKKLWGFVSCNDSFIRRVACQLLIACLEKQPQAVGEKLVDVSQALVADGLHASHSTSSLQFLQALTQVTKAFPDIWTSAYSSKKPALSRLEGFIKKGSQSGPPDYWNALFDLMVSIPLDMLPMDVTIKTAFLTGLQTGAANEPKSHSLSAWTCYVKTVKFLTTNMPDDQNLCPLVERCIFSLFRHYLFPDTGDSMRNLSDGADDEITVLTRAYFLCAAAPQKAVKSSFEQEWARLGEELILAMSISLPEQSRDHNKSQSSVAATGTSWFKLEGRILKALKDDEGDEVALTTRKSFAESSEKIVNRALEILRSRNGKPFGVARVIEGALKYTPSICNVAPALLDGVESFLENDMHKMLVSPSSSYIIEILFVFKDLDGKTSKFESFWISAIDGLCALPDDDTEKDVAIAKLVATNSIERISRQHHALQTYLTEIIYRVGCGESRYRPLFEAAISYSVADSATLEVNLKRFISILGRDLLQPESVLSALEVIAQHSPLLLQHTSESYVELLGRLLALSQVPDLNIRQRASSLKTLLSQPKYFQSGDYNPQLPIVQMIQSNLIEIGPQALDAKTLSDLAIEILEDEKCKAIDVAADISVWQTALQPLLCSKPDPSLSLTNVLAGSAAIVEAPINGTSASAVPPERDSNGYSTAFRIASYTARLIATDKFIDELPSETQIDVLYFSLLTLELSKDQLGLKERNKLWANLENPTIDDDVQNFVSIMQSSINLILGKDKSWRKAIPQAGWFKSIFGQPENSVLKPESSTLVLGLLAKLLAESSGLSPTSFYSARVLSNVLSTLVEACGWQVPGSEDWLTSIAVLRSFSKNTVFAAVAVLSGLKEALSSSKVVGNLSNRLISDVAGIKHADDTTVQRLVLLNACLEVYADETLSEGLFLPVTANRIIFAVKQILDWAEIPRRETDSLTAESCRVLQKLLAAMKDTYGQYWESAIAVCSAVWDAAASPQPTASLPTVHASLRLFSLLDSLKEPNDDLEEVLSQKSAEITHSLLQLLKRKRRREDQPSLIVDELLCRMVAKRPSSEIEAPEDLYHLIASDNQLIQTAAFRILHETVSAAQDQISLDVLLEKKDAKLPDELLSLLLDPPSIHNFSDERLVEFPFEIRGYLLSWLLVFQSYPASPKVRNDYTELLKQGEYLDPLLTFIFDILGHSIGNPLGLDKAGLTPNLITSFDLELTATEPEEKNMQWLLVHLYYLCLKLTPNMAKNWWMYCKSKQTRIAVESWTERYFSSLVIGDNLEEISKWAQEQPVPGPTDDEKELIIKISKPSREIFAAYEVDDTQIQAVIRFPSNYPLESVTVEGIQRVAVSEKRWKNWLMATQGVIKFSNGSITEGLSTFRKNIIGALKGQTECAICYSLVSEDKRMPEKRCQTCKNLFHSSCLFKWFASSNQSSCPLCRNPFNYGAPARRAFGGLD